MAEVEDAIVKLLTEDASVSELAGDRVRPLTGAQGQQRPYIAYEIDDGESIVYLNGDVSEWERGSFTLANVADTYDDCAALSRATKRRLRAVHGIINGIRLAPCRFESESDIEQQPQPGTDQQVYVRTQTYRVQYREDSDS